jgi:hypothetical protein
LARSSVLPKPPAQAASAIGHSKIAAHFADVPNFADIPKCNSFFAQPL